MVSITPSAAAFAPQTLPARALALCTYSPLAFAPARHATTSLNSCLSFCK